MGIPFTEFLRPNGQRIRTMITRSAEIEGLAEQLTKRGASFEIEYLRTGHVNMEIMLADECMAGNLVPSLEEGGDPKAMDLRIHGELVGKAVDQMVRAAYNTIVLLPGGEGVPS